MTEIEHGEDLEDLTGELKRREARHVEERTKLIAALNTALMLIEQLLADMRYAGVTPTATLMIAKGNFDAEMKKLLGDAHTPTEIIISRHGN